MDFPDVCLEAFWLQEWGWVLEDCHKRSCWKNSIRVSVPRPYRSDVYVCSKGYRLCLTVVYWLLECNKVPSWIEPPSTLQYHSSRLLLLISLLMHVEFYTCEWNEDILSELPFSWHVCWSWGQLCPPCPHQSSVTLPRQWYVIRSIKSRRNQTVTIKHCLVVKWDNLIQRPL
jgi:hypothetical protein